MQACFLYLGVFPQGFDIPSRKLIHLWIAEGLISNPNGSQELEETAMTCLNNLVNINLVIVTQKALDGNPKTCRLHGILHQFCKEEASSKGHFKELRPTPDQASLFMQDPGAFRRLTIHPSFLSDFLSTKSVAEHVRSFYCFSSKTTQAELPQNGIRDIPKAFPLIKVLDIQPVKFAISKAFYRLIHLRYLAITAELQIIPKPFELFLNLQTLIVNTSTSRLTLDVRANIWNMSQLRHLYTNVPARLPSPYTSTAETSNLLTLSHVASESCDNSVLAQACNLKKLSIRGKMDAFLQSDISNLEELKYLQKLNLLNDGGSDKVFQLPRTFKFARNLMKLTLSNTRFDWGEAHRLGELEFLEVLKLKEYAFTGESWKLAEIRGFSQLQTLWIERADLRIWEASGVHFPCLRLLVLIFCDKLEGVPYELADVASLQEMRLENTPRAVKSARDIERKKFESINFKLFIFPPEMET